MTEASRVTRPLIIAATAAYCIGNVGWWMMPSIIHGATIRFQLGEANAGLVGSVEMASIAVSAAATTRAIGRIKFRPLALVGAMLALIGTGLSIAAASFGTLVAARILTGLGEGVPLAVASAALAGLPDPGKAYSRVNVANALLGVICMYLVPVLTARFALVNPTMPALAVILGALSLAVLAMPREAGRPAHQTAIPASSTSHGIMSVKTARIAGAVFLVGVMSSALFAFWFEMGAKAGLDAAGTNGALAVAAGTSVLGGVLASLVASRLGTIVPLTIGIVTLSVAMLMLAIVHDPLAFRLGACLNLIAIGFSVPYFLTLAAAQDPSGRDGAVVSGAFLGTAAVGPYLGGLLLEMTSSDVVGVLALVANLAAWLLFVSVDRQVRGQARATPAGASRRLGASA